ncbi:MAG: hypothetical protein ABJN38_11890 [Lentilitoribacter sp.]
MNKDPTFQYLKLFMEYVPLWLVAVFFLIFVLWRNPGWLEKFPKYIASIRFGDFEMQLREVNAKLRETEQHVAELEEESIRLNQLYEGFDVDGPAEALDGPRQALKALSGNLDNMAPVIVALQPGSSSDDVYAAAEILRSRRDFSTFDALITTVDRIASDQRLEGLRYRTVWTLASAVHRTVLAAVKHSSKPALRQDQLQRAKTAMQKLHDNGHVQDDRPDDPKKGIRGPSGYALNWIDKGLEKYKAEEA